MLSNSDRVTPSSCAIKLSVNCLRGQAIHQAVACSGEEQCSGKRLQRCQLSDDVVRLRTAIEAKATDDVKRIAHTNVGGCITCGMDALAALMRELEEMGQSGQLACAASVVAKVERELERTKTFLHDSLKLETMT